MWGCSQAESLRHVRLIVCDDLEVDWQDLGRGVLQTTT